jgi:hypothetical protein
MGKYKSVGRSSTNKLGPQPVFKTPVGKPSGGPNIISGPSSGPGKPYLGATKPDLSPPKIFRGPRQD